MRLGMASVMLLALMTASAQAQIGNTPGVSPGTSAAMNVGKHSAEAEQKGESAQKVRANDNAYNAALKNLPDKQYDPWHGVR
jgi:hypothetical protein